MPCCEKAPHPQKSTTILIEDYLRDLSFILNLFLFSIWNILFFQKKKEFLRIQIECLEAYLALFFFIKSIFSDFSVLFYFSMSKTKIRSET